MTLPDSALAPAMQVLEGLSEERRTTFRLRLERYLPDLVEPLDRLYPGRAEEVAERLIHSAAEAYATRTEDLRQLDERRLLTPDWLQQPNLFGYACYADRFAGDLRALPTKLDYLEELGVTYLHLMPLLLPREGDNDGGYAVADYRSIRPDLGTTDDLQVLTAALRERGVSLCLDLVLNHVAREHDWAARARRGEQKYRDYFFIYPDRTEPDAYESTLPEVFPAFAPGNFTWDDEVQGWVWTTFNEFQWDVNWANPDVLIEYADIVLYLANLGVEVLRLDAIAFTWKRLGTNSQNQPEVHDLTQVLRALARIACPAVAFKAEAIVGPRDLVQYLGRGTHAGKVSDLAYHNSLMVQIWSMLATGETRLAQQAPAALPAKAVTSGWITYARCHDDIGWAIDDGDAAVVGLSGHEHRRFLSDWYAGDFPTSPARGLVFQHNEATGDKRISGTAASLVGLEDGIDPAARLHGIQQVRLAHALIAGWGGIPVVWSGDELAQPNDPDWALEPGHEDDNRWAHRPKLDWERADERHVHGSTAYEVFGQVAHIARTRASLPQLHGSAESRIVTDVDDRLLVFTRNHASGPMVQVYNVSGDYAHIPWWVLHRSGLDGAVDALTGEAVFGDQWGVTVPPYAAWWLIAG